MSDLKDQLASLRIDRESARGGGAGRWLALLAAALLLAAGGTWFLLGGGIASLRAVEIETVRPQVRAATGPAPGTALLTASGYVVPRRKAVVSAKIQGRLSELKVEEGSRVEKDEIIARLESADYLANVSSGRAAVQRAEADLAEQERQLRLSRQMETEKVVSRDVREAAESRVRMAAASLEQSKALLQVADAQYRNTLIRAPFKGVVLKKMAEVGESVAPIPPGVNISSSSGAIVALADLDTLEVEADVSESNVARLGPDQPAEVSVEAFPDKTYKAVLRQIIPTADRTRATVMVKVTILDKDPNLKPEMNAKVNFVEKQAPAAPADASAPPPPPTITVPDGAVVERAGASTVFEVRDGRARALSIETAGTRGGETVVRHGLSGTETLVLRPPTTLNDGDKVRIRS
ncbi:MAG TPA: efflux RND transporter periplasmic adaptor subunit [Candidatus Polarisedimenticolia bacterium]|nr:efflux RND transporter periplasmic adaptor subunit [Candidatus Polarisedimenticolia bacterium]